MLTLVYLEFTNSMNIKSWSYALLLIGLLGFGMTACEEDPTPTPAPEAENVEPQAVAINPPRVWIDSPLTDEIVVLGSTSIPIIAHAASLTGGALLNVRDANGSLLTTLDLGSPLEVEQTGGALARYEGEWLPIEQESGSTNADGFVVYELTVEVGGVVSGPVYLYALQATPTPSATSTATLTPTATATATPTASATSTATSTSTSTLTMTWTPTATLTPTTTTTGTATSTISATPTLTPSLTASPTNTVSPTATITNSPSPTVTGTATPVIEFDPKELIPCEIGPIRGREVVARVGPGDNRGPLQVLEFGDRYLVTGKNDTVGENWWQISLAGVPQAWAKDADVNEYGGCGNVSTVDAPDVTRPTGPRPPTNNGPTNTPVPGATPSPVIHYFYADYYDLPVLINSTYVYCTNIYWSVEYVDSVYLSSSYTETTEGVVGVGSRQICPDVPDGTTLYFTITIYKAGVAVDDQTIGITYEDPYIIE